mmetsp:Transcript_18343/g.29471  ORF Transcript_18343/g.29471 Transcript_18343/m.29471 type:complete len:926 (+) Transcript_18343:11700-14477(+)
MKREFDYLIIGGGSAGAVLARRLADADIGTVCLIEAGSADENDPTQLDIRRIQEQSKELDWGFMATRVEGTVQDLNYLRAKSLGGCGNHNDCAWLIPPDGDFERWTSGGATGWDPKAMKPIFDKIHDQLNVDRPAPDHPVTRAFLQAAGEQGLASVDLLNSFQSGAGMIPLNARGPLRESASVAYLHPLDRLPDRLTLYTDTLAHELIFDGTRVTGCRTDRGDLVVRREVIVAAGSIGTPHLLMVSGIGDAADLHASGISPRVDLPGVGRNLMDHFSASVVFDLPDDIPPWKVTPYEAMMLIRAGSGDTPADCLVHFGLMAGSAEGRETGLSGPIKSRSFDLAPNVMRPESRGQVSLLGKDIGTPPRIDLRYFSDPEGNDLKLVRNALQFCLRFGDTQAFRSLGATLQRPVFADMSDTALDDYILNTCETVYHACGTCRMGSLDDPNTVVGPDLAVKGVQGLRVCDASVFPEIVSVNINATVMAVAEKGANYIIDAAAKEKRSSATPRKPCGIVVDAYSTGRFLPAEFAKLGVEVHHVQSMPEILEFDKPYFHSEEFVSNTVFDGDLGRVSDRLKELGARFVVPGCESGVILADALADALDLPGNGTAHSTARRNKDEMGAALAAAGLRHIRYIATDDPRAALAWASENGLRNLVVKPINSAGTEDLYFCRSDADVESAFGRILGKINAMGAFNERALVQERIVGQQFTANTVSTGGLHYLGELWTYNTVEVPHAGSLCEHEVLLDGSNPAFDALKPYVIGVLDALGIENGPAHMELFCDANGPVLIEMGARMQGSMSRDATLAALGHDHVSLTALAMSDVDSFKRYAALHTPYRRKQHAIIASVLSNRSGTVVGKSGLNKIRNMESFKDAISFPNIGDKVAVSLDLATTAGIVYFVHDDEATVRRDWQLLKGTPIDRILDIEIG